MSDAFTFQEKERQNSESDVFDKDHQDTEPEGLEMKRTKPVKPAASKAGDGCAADSAQEDGSGKAAKEALPPLVVTKASVSGSEGASENRFDG